MLSRSVWPRPSYTRSPPMNNADRDLMLSSDAQQIKAYCSEFGDQIGLKLEDVVWGMDENPPYPGAPYKLTVKVRPHKLPWDWFTREDIAGYKPRHDIVYLSGEI